MKLLFFRRRFKAFFMQFRLHYVFGIFEKVFLTLAYLSKLSRWRLKQGKLGYNDFPVSSVKPERRYGLYQHVQENYLKDHEIVYLEFGVAGADSFRWWLKNHVNQNSKFYGFDTFTGLPEDWGPFKKGTFAQHEIPKIDDSRGAFLQGLFQQTLIPFIEKNNLNEKRLVIHLDADLYSATLFVLSQLYSKLKPGDIILFDEYNVPLSEFKAFEDFTSSFYVNYEVLGAVNNYFQVAVQVK
jgi:O-methyltransferase